MKPFRHSPSGVAAILGVALALLISGCASLPTLPPAPAHPSTASIPVPQRLDDRLPQSAVNGFNQRHEDYAARARRGGIDLLFLGDSITQGWSGPGREAWSKFYGGMNAASFGIGYERTQHLLWRLQNGEGAGFSPKAVVLLIGTNNIGLNPPAEIAEGIAAVLRELRERFPTSKILLLGILPRDFPGSRNRELVAATNRLIAPFQDGRHIFYLDLADKFIGADGNIPRDLMADVPPLHPTAKGYAVWAEALQAPLAKLMQ